ncbi:MAG: hypothetical protein ABSB53_05125 [Nitrososphaerales archaeon]|jgi:hypothetical protein
MALQTVRRRVYMTGKGLSVILPASWAKSNGVEETTILELVFDEGPFLSVGKARRQEEGAAF